MVGLKDGAFISGVEKGWYEVEIACGVVVVDTGVPNCWGSCPRSLMGVCDDERSLAGPYGGKDAVDWAAGEARV